MSKRMLVRYSKTDYSIVQIEEPNYVFDTINDDECVLPFECNGTETHMSEIEGFEIPDLTQRVSLLWEACTKYQEERLNASGFVKMQYLADKGGIKAQAIVDWVETLWNSYYVKKIMIESGEVVEYSFDEHGELPYNFYEAYGEAIVLTSSSSSSSSTE